MRSALCKERRSVIFKISSYKGLECSSYLKKVIIRTTRFCNITNGSKLRHRCSPKQVSRMSDEDISKNNIIGLSLG